MKHYILENEFDECGVAITAVPNTSENMEGKDYWKRAICYINFNTEGVSLHQNYITLQMLQEISRNINELAEAHKKYLGQMAEKNQDAIL